MNLHSVGRCVKSAIVTLKSSICAETCLSFLMRPLQKFVEQAQLVHHLKRRWMDRVAAKITQEVLVLLKDDNFHAGARQQKAQHHAGWSSAGYAAMGIQPTDRHRVPPEFVI